MHLQVSILFVEASHFLYTCFKIVIFSHMKIEEQNHAILSIIELISLWCQIVDGLEQCFLLYFFNNVTLLCANMYV